MKILTVIGIILIIIFSLYLISYIITKLFSSKESSGSGSGSASSNSTTNHNYTSRDSSRKASYKRKVTIILKQKRYVFGLMKAKYWAEIEEGKVGDREGFRNINIYEAELHCKHSVLGFDSVQTGQRIAFSNQDKLRKKFNAITLADGAGSDPNAPHVRDTGDIEELAGYNSDDENIRKALRKYFEDYNAWKVRSFKTNFISSFPTPLKTFIHSDNGTDLFELNFESAKLYNFKLSKVQDEGKESFGTIKGAFIGYVIQEIPQEIAVEITPEPTGGSVGPEPEPGVRKYPYYTGRKETKTVGREIFQRFEICEAPGEFSWTEWTKVGIVEEPQRIYTFWEAVFWLIVFIIFLALLIKAPYLLLGIAIVGGLLWLLSLNIFGKVFGFIGKLLGGILTTLSVIFLVGGLIAFLANADLFGRNHAPVVDAPKEGDSQQQIVDNDTIIAQYREWTDYHGNKYSGYLKIRANDYKNSKSFRSNYHAVIGVSDYSRMCTSLYVTDSSRMKFVYEFFDSLQIARKLTRDQFAEAVVTCVQDIPYYLITPGPCDYSAYPANDFAHNYLLGGGLCEGYETNGILSPAEFTATLKGDCDTRTVFTYTILKHFGYQVSVYGSEYYSHSILGIALEDRPMYNVTSKTEGGVTYAMCELTTYGPKLGQLPEEVSDMSKWYLELK